MNRQLLANLDSLFEAIDAKDTSRFLSFLTDDCIFRFGSVAPVTGHEAIRTAVDGFFASISASRHTVQQTLSNDTALVCEGVVNYRRHDGTEVSLPFSDIFEFDGELISCYKIYMDIAPLYAQ